MGKRSINKQNWATSKGKKSQKASEEYIKSRGKKIPAKKVEMRKDCLWNCKFRCSEKINSKTQEEIFMDFTNQTQQGIIFSSAKQVFAHQRLVLRNQFKERKVTPNVS